MGTLLEFRTEPDETAEKMEEVVIGAVYRVWTKSGACVIEWTSRLVDVEVLMQPDVGGEKVAPFFSLQFENGAVLQSRTGWGVSLYRKGERYGIPG